MSAKGLAFKYLAGQLRGDRDNMAERGRGVNTVNAGHYGALLAVHSAAPPPIDAYDEWLVTALSGDKRAKPKITGSKLRRAVVMKRSGCGIAEIRRAVGVSSVNEWLNRLPADLAA